MTTRIYAAPAVEGLNYVVLASPYEVRAHNEIAL